MIKLMKLLKELSKKGWATKSEKAEVTSLVKELATDEAEVVADEVATVEALPETDPKKADEASELVEEIAGAVEEKMAKKFDAKMKSIEEEVEAWVAKQKLLDEAKAGNYADGAKEKRAKTNTYLRDLMGAITSNDFTKVKELTTGDAGENIVDRELSAEIRHLMTEYGVARREFFTTVLSKNAYDANALATDVTVSWVSEGNTIPTVSITVNQEELKLKKLAAIATMTRELLEDQEIDLFSFIAGRVAEGFAKAEDNAFFNGEGTGDTANAEYTGLLYNTDIEDVIVSDKGGSSDGTSIAHIGVEDIYAMIDKLPQGAHAGAKFFFNRTILSKIRLIKDGDGRYIYQNPLDVSGVPTLVGYPAVLVEAMPSFADDDADLPFMLFGDLRKTAILGYKGSIAVDRFNAGVVRNQANNGDVNLITTDREAVRWVSRVGYITILPSACVRLNTADNS
jgi:HK97 family phage major capsid protein